MTKFVNKAGLAIDAGLYEFITGEAMPGLQIDAERFWTGFGAIVDAFTPENRNLLARRESLQSDIDDWHIKRRETGYEIAEYRAFLEEIGYLSPEGAAFSVATENVDPEIAAIAGPQLVVPITNARFALNAANARWGSLYDALYGTDALGDEPVPGPYDPDRGARVIAWARDFLDTSVPISASWASASGLSIRDEKLVVDLDSGGTAQLEEPAQLVGFRGKAETPEAIVLKRHGLHLEIVIDRNHPIGRQDRAGIADVLLEAALTTIMDCEDSIAAVDAEDKTLVYRNWLGLMKGDLEEAVTKDGRTFTRRLNVDRDYVDISGRKKSLKGRSLMLVRNVGHLMTNPAIFDRNGDEVFEGIMDAMITSLIALHDIGPTGRRINSEAGSMYIVKPKMHGPQEVSFACDLFSRVEEVLGMAPNTIKVGIMDEERRTSANLFECIRAASERIAFINTGFLDRTGDEIHTSMEAGPMIRKGDMKQSVWIGAYEDRNVDIGLECGLAGRAQIGKGMWAMPDKMAAMLEQKIAHPLAGANTAWVPSPTAATLHATHYHRVDVAAVQEKLKGRERAPLEDLLSIPVASRPNWSDADKKAELRNNAQGILGYVVRWIDQGIGCSKVPDINDVGLMEDRATLRISSQHIANWLHHGVVTHDEVMEVMREMAQVVDRQNAGDPAYRPMAADFDASIAFRAACDLVFEGTEQPSGYTEPILHRRRLQVKSRL